MAGVPAPAAATPPPNFEEITLTSGIRVPTAVAWAPDGRAFVAELGGRVHVIEGGRRLPEPLVDISGHVNRYGERGLLGIAVDSDFESNHYLYLLYSYEGGGNTSDPGPKTARLTRVVVRPDNTVSNPSSPETVILGADSQAPCPPPANDSDCIPDDSSQHTVGTVRSDEDGTLWVGTGDASKPSVNDSRSLRTYDERSYAGKIIHVDRSGRGLPGHPFCPSDDDLSHVCTKLYAKGFRNPFRFTLREGGLGPVVGDVGFQTEEEVNLTAPGRDYGWPCFEGGVRTPGWQVKPECQAYYAAASPTGPDFRYGRDTGAAVVAGPTYPGGDYPDDFDGTIFIGDYVEGWIGRLRLGPGAPSLEPFVTSGPSPLDLELAPNGNLVYTTAADWTTENGRVTEIAYCPANCAPVARASATPSVGDPPLEVAFDAGGSTDSDGDTLSYEWDFGDGSAKSAEVAPKHEYTLAGVHRAVVTATDPGGRSGEASVLISVGNGPPTVTIEAPGPGHQYVAGEAIQLKGAVSDPEEGALNPEGIEWRLLLHHGEHIHPYNLLQGETVEFLPRTDHDADSWVEVRATARDSAGLEGVATRELRPRTVPLTLRSSPEGVPLSYGGRTVVTPYAAHTAVGFETTLTAPTVFGAGGRTHVFDRWSDGGPQNRELVVPDRAIDLTASYRDESRRGDESPGPAEPPPPEDSGLSDLSGPVLGFDRVRGARPPSRLTGSAFDPSGVESVLVAVRAQRRRGHPCRWWLAGQGRLATRPTACASPRWIRTKLTRQALGVNWRAALGGRLPARRYEVLFRARDGLGHRTRQAGGRSRIAFKVARRR